MSDDKTSTPGAPRKLREPGQALKQYIEKRIDASQPVVHKSPDFNFDNEITFETFGRAGETKTIAHTPSEQLGDGVLYLFRGNKFIASDSLDGHGTFVRAINVGNTPQMMPGARASTATAFSGNSLGGGVSYALCHPRMPISVEVEFVADCEFSAIMRGKAVAVPNEGVYTITPTIPCDIEISKDLVETDLRYKRCDRCWFPYERHPRWTKSGDRT